MSRPPVSTERFIEVWRQTGGSPSKVAEVLGFASQEGVSHRRRRIEKKLGITLMCGSKPSERNVALKKANNRRLELTLPDGIILIGSDAHVWPGPLTTAQRGFLAMAKRLKPDVVVMNGDVFDGARISRHPAGIWDQQGRPSVVQELEACQSFLGAVHKATGPARHIWTWGNHDARFEYRAAAMVPEYEGVPGLALKDHFPEWLFCMAVFVNDNLVIKHRLANGIHAAHNNAVKSGRSMVTGHLHSPKVWPWTDYNGTRYGVDCGTLSDPDSKQFDYGEEGPANHRAGFAIVTVRDSKLLMPELCQVWDEDHVEFRGELIPV
jgi:hypothetical protein